MTSTRVWKRLWSCTTGGGRDIQTDASEVNVTLKAFSRGGERGVVVGGGGRSEFIHQLCGIHHLLFARRIITAETVAAPGAQYKDV